MMRYLLVCDVVTLAIYEYRQLNMYLPICFCESLCDVLDKVNLLPVNDYALI